MRILAITLLALGFKTAFALDWVNCPTTISPGQNYTIKVDDGTWWESVTLRIYRDGVLVSDGTGNAELIYPEEGDPYYEYFSITYDGQDAVGPIVFTATLTTAQGTTSITRTLTIIGAPTAAFTTNVSAGRSPATVSFDASGSTGSAPLSYAWNMDNAGANEATGVSPNYTYSHGGSEPQTFTAKLIVYASSGAGNWTTRQVVIYPSYWNALTVLNGSASPSAPYLWGTSVSLTAAAPAASSQAFTGWVVISGSGTFASASSTTTSYTSGYADTTLRATYGPSIPVSVAVTSATYASVSLAWTASVDDIAVAGYDIYRTQGGVTNLVGTATSATFTDTHVRPGSAYSYYVKARDGSANISAASNTVSVTTGDVPVTGGIPTALRAAAFFNLPTDSVPVADSALSLNPHRPSQ